MKGNYIKKSLFFTISCIIILRILLIFVPIYSSKTTIKILDNQLNYLNRYASYKGLENCLNINPSYDKSTNVTKFDLTSRSIKKQKSIKCIDDGVNYIENLIDKRNDLYENWLYKSVELNNKVDESIDDFKVRKILDKDKLKLINEYFRNINIMRDKDIVLLPLSYEIKTNPTKNNNLFRFLFSGFIVIFWITYFILSDLEKISDD